MPYDLSLIEVRILLEDEFQRDSLVFIGILRKHILNVKQVGDGFFIVFGDLID